MKDINKVLNNSFVPELEEALNSAFKKDVDVDNINNIFVKCNITKKEAENGCVKAIKYIWKTEKKDNQKETIEVIIPKGIAEKRNLVIKSKGNYLEDNSYSDLIIKTIVHD